MIQLCKVFTAAFSDRTMRLCISFKRRPLGTVTEEKGDEKMEKRVAPRPRMMHQLFEVHYLYILYNNHNLIQFLPVEFH